MGLSDEEGESHDPQPESGDGAKPSERVQADDVKPRGVAEGVFLAHGQVVAVEARKPGGPIRRRNMHAQGNDERAGGDVSVGKALDEIGIEGGGLKRRNGARCHEFLAVDVDLEGAVKIELLQRQAGLVGRNLHMQAIPDHLRPLLKIAQQRLVRVHDRPLRIVEIGLSVGRVVVGLEQPGHVKGSGMAQRGGVKGPCLGGLCAERRGRDEQEAKEREEGNPGQTPGKAQGGGKEHRADAASSR